MNKYVNWTLPILFLAVLTLSGCVAGGGASNSNALVSGFNQGGAAPDATNVNSGEMATVISANTGAIAIYNGTTQQLSKGMTIPANAIVKSGNKGKTTVQFANGKTVSIPPKKELALAEVAPVAAQPAQSETFSQKISKTISGQFSRKNTMASGTAQQTTIGVRGLQGN